MPTLPVELKTAPWKDRAGRLSGLKAIVFLLLHVPAAWMAMFIYLVMAFWSAISLSCRPSSTSGTNIEQALAQVAAPPLSRRSW